MSEISERHISQEVTSFGKDYLKHKLSSEQAKKLAEGEMSYAQARRLFEEMFLQDSELNPGSLAVRDFFISESKEELNSKIARLRYLAGIPSTVPLGQWISFAESVVVDSDESVRRKYNQIFETGLVRDELRKKLRFENDALERDIVFFVQNQSAEGNRSLVEVTCNAIDFSDADQEVSVTVTEEGYSVRDWGKGMTPHELIESLSIPFMSGARGKDKESIGKFGMGFLTILRHLQEEGDSVTVDTGRDVKGYRLTFTIQDGELVVMNAVQNEVTQGTRIALRCAQFDKQDADALLRKHLEYKVGANVLLNNERFDKLDRLQILSAEDKSGKYNLLYEPRSEDDTEDFHAEQTCDCTIAVNGIVLFKKNMKGYNIPPLVVLDFPYKTRITEARDMIAYNQESKRVCQGMIRLIAEQVHDVSHKVQLLNILTEIVYELEKKAVEKDTDSLIAPIGEELKKIIVSGGYTPVPGVEHAHAIGVVNPLLINPKQREVLAGFIQSIDRLPLFESQNYTCHAVPMREGVQIPALIYRNKILVDKDLYAKLKSAPQLLEGYIQLLIRNEHNEKIRIHSPEEPALVGQSDTESEPFYADKPFDRECIQELHNAIMERERSGVPFVSRARLEEYLAMSPEAMEEAFCEDFIAYISALYPDLIPKAKKKAIAQHLEERCNADPENEELYKIYRRYQRSLWDDTESSSLPPYDMPRTCASVSEIMFVLSDNISVEEKKRNGYFHIQHMLNYVEGLSEYRKVLAKLPTQELRTTFEQLMMTNFPNDRREFRPYKYFITHRYLDYRHNQVTGFREFHYLCKGLEKFLTTNPEATNIWHNIRQLMERQGGEDAEQLQYFLTFLIAPYTSYHSYYNASSFVSSNKVHPIVEYGYNSDSKQKIIREIQAVRDGRTRHMYNIGVHTGEEMVQRITKRHEIATQNMQNLVDKYSFLMGEELGGKILAQHRHMFDEMFKSEYGSLDKDDRYLYSPWFIENLLVSNTEGSFAPLSDAKKDIITKVFADHFNPDTMTQHDFVRFVSYVKRVMLFADMDDVVFEQMQSVFLYAPKKLFEPHRSADYNHIFRPPYWDMLQQHIDTLQNVDIAALLDIWDKITLVQNKLRKGDPGYIDEEELQARFLRLIHVFQDIGRKHLGLQEAIIEILKSSGKTSQKNRFGEDFFHFVHDKADLNDLLFLVTPYVLYYRQGGDRAVRNEHLLSKIRPEGEKFMLSNMVLYRRMQHGSFKKVLQERQGLAQKVQAYAEGKFPFTAQREVLHAVSHLPANDPYLFLRELVQNAYDASMQHKSAEDDSTVPEILINDYTDRLRYVVEISDTVGMSYETVMGNLLTPNVSGKKEGSTLGRFGTGFMSILDGAERVEISTVKDGYLTEAVITPVYNDAYEVVDFNVVSSCKQTENKNMTLIRKYIDTLDYSNLDSAKLQTATMKYGSYLSSDDVSVKFRGEKVNTPRACLAEKIVDGIGTVQVLEGLERNMLQGRLFVTELPDYIQDMIPSSIKDLVLKHGFVLNLDNTIELIRSRSDIANKQDVLPALRSIVPELAIQSTLQKFARGEFDIALIPYDYFWVDGFAAEFADRMGGAQTMQDAEILNNGGSIESCARYEERKFFLELLTIIKFLDYKGEKLSLREIAIKIQEGEKFDGPGIPKRIKELSKGAHDRIDYIKDQIQSFETNGEQEAQPFHLLDKGRQILQRESDTHLAFLRVSEMTTTYPDISYIGFYNVPNAAGATAFPEIHAKYWNLLGIEYTIMKLQQLLRDYKSNGSISDYEIGKTIAPVVITNVHEDAHLINKDPHFANEHNDVFYARMQKLLGELLYKQQELYEQMRNEFRDFTGTLLPRTELLQKLGRVE